MLRALVSALLLLFASHHAFAQEDDRLARARARFEAGRALYSLGDYEAALREFAAGYQLVPKPQFLINLGQTYRKLERYDRAREMYNKFLAEAPPDDPSRPAIARILVELQHEEPPKLEEPSPAPQAPPPVVVVKTTPPPPHRFDRRHLGWILPLSALVVAGAAVGIYFAVRPNDGCIAGLPCVDSTGH
jgi:tetratricopeptide (TPR) repeat protein